MASGDTLDRFSPRTFEPAASNPATPAGRNAHPVLEFDDTAGESAVWTSIMPRHYRGGGLTVRVHFAMKTATSGTVDWDVCFERIGEGQQDIDEDGFAAAQSADDNTVPATCGHVAVAEITLSDGAQIDGILAGELFRTKLTRDAASDDAAGDAQVLAVEVKET